MSLSEVGRGITNQPLFLSFVHLPHSSDAPPSAAWLTPWSPLALSLEVLLRRLAGGVLCPIAHDDHHLRNPSQGAKDSAAATAGGVGGKVPAGAGGAAGSAAHAVAGGQTGGSGICRGGGLHTWACWAPWYGGTCAGRGEGGWALSAGHGTR